MYLPDPCRVEDVPRMHALVRSRPFAVLVSAGSRGDSLSRSARPSMAVPAVFGGMASIALGESASGVLARQRPPPATSTSGLR
jgi:predicted FMN-binding regulatory protein PaiB